MTTTTWIKLTISVFISIFHVDAIYISPSPKPITVNQFIQDDNMMNYLNDVFASVRFPESVYKNTPTNINMNTNTNTNIFKNNRHNPNYCQCDGCYIEDECLGFLRKNICDNINGSYCE